MKRLVLWFLVLGLTAIGATSMGDDVRFIAYDNGTVLDTRTNLMWAAKDNGSDVNWHEAKSYCENYRGGGYNNWRMATIDELSALYDENEGYETPMYYDAYITSFIQLSSCCMWSSDTRGSNEAAYFSFQSNMRIWMAQSEPGNGKRRALPVRSVN
jgi:hypothetical protein